MKNQAYYLTSLCAAALALISSASAEVTPNAKPLPAKSAVKATDVWVVIKSHFDLGFTDLAENVFQRYRTEMMDNSLKIVEQNRMLPKEKQFVWTVPGWPLKNQMLGPKQTPERRTKIEQAVKEGSLAVHALAFTTHTESLDLEDLVRGFGYSSAIARQYGHPLPIAAKMTDVPSHSWVLPTLLCHAGVKFLHLGCNPASQYPRVPLLFWWEGADGSRILCGYTAEYGSRLDPPSDWPCKNYLAMIMANDNQGPPRLADVQAMRDHYSKEMPGVHVHFGTLDEFAKAVLEEQPTLPVVRGDMPDTWIHGLMSMPQATKAARDIRPLEPTLDILDTQLRVWGLAPAPLACSLAAAYENSLLYGEHTWGMNAELGPRYLYGDAWRKWVADMNQEPIPADGDYSKLPRGSKRKWMQSFEDHRNYANTAARIVREELASRLELLAANVKAKAGDIIVYNPLPWERSATVGIGGKQIFAQNVPGCGYKTFSVKPIDQATSSQKVLETPYFTAAFDLERGGISSLVEKTTGRELADRSSPYVLGQFLHERFSTNEIDRFFKKYSRIQGGWGLSDLGKPGMLNADQVPYLSTTPSGWTIAVIHSPLADVATLSAADTKGLAKGYSIVFTFSCHEPSVEVEWKVDTKTADKHPEGGWLCFPFALEKPVFTVGRLGAPINPATDIVPGTNRHLLAVNTGVALTGPDTAGVALCPLDSPLVSLEKPGLWWWTMDFVPKQPTVFVNLYNNMWNTNFPLWQDGSWSERVRFWPTGKGTATVTDLTVKSWEARLPLLAVSLTGQHGTLPAEQTGISLSRKGVLVTAFGANPDGAGTVLRVWEQSGISGEVTVTLPTGANFSTAKRADLRGETSGDSLPVTGGKFSFSAKAYAPASFILTN